MSGEANTGRRGSVVAEAASDPLPFDQDRPLVEAARRDPRAFEALYRRYVSQVYTFAYHELGSHQDAEDATAGTFLAALKALPAFRGQSTFRVWLFRIARNAIANERRRRRRHPVVPLDGAVFTLAPSDPAGEAERRDDVRRVLAAVGRLPEERRQALHMRIVHELTPAEIGAILGRSEGAVRVLVHRALRAVAREVVGSAHSARGLRER